MRICADNLSNVYVRCEKNYELRKKKKEKSRLDSMHASDS